MFSLTTLFAFNACWLKYVVHKTITFQLKSDYKNKKIVTSMENNKK